MVFLELQDYLNNIMGNNYLKKIIKQHALEDAPRECCGFVVLDKKTQKPKLVKCENIARNPIETFYINPEHYIKTKKEEVLLGIYHSHPTTTKSFSIADERVAEYLNLTSYLYVAENDKLEVFVPDGTIPPLEGREFIWGIMDCWMLVSDYLKINLNIDVRDYHIKRICSEDVDVGNLFSVGFSEEKDLFFDKNDQYQFVKVDKNLDNLKVHDVLLMKLGKVQNPNHIAVYVGDNMIFHHVHLRVSQKTFFGSYWKNCVDSIWRIKRR